MKNPTYQWYLSAPNVPTPIAYGTHREQSSHRIELTAKQGTLALLNSASLRGSENNTAIEVRRNALERAGTAFIEIGPGKPLRIRNGRGATLQVQRGAVWITQSGDSQDIHLNPGESFCIDRDGLTLASALGGEAFALVALQSSIPPARSRVVSWIADLVDWCASLRRFPTRPASGWA